MDQIMLQQLEQLKFILTVAGGLISILMLAVIYFLKDIHKDIKNVKLEQADQRERLAVLEYRVSEVDGKPTFVENGNRKRRRSDVE